MRQGRDEDVALGRGHVPDVLEDESGRMGTTVETLSALLAFWPCECREPDIDGTPIERRRDGERVVDVRSCSECWGDRLAVIPTS